MRSSGSTSTVGHDTDVVVVTCSDPRVADVAKGMDARFVRIPGVGADPAGGGFVVIMAYEPKVVAFLCHNDCKAHHESLDAAKACVEKARIAFARRWLGMGTMFLAGVVDANSRYTYFLRGAGVWDPAELLASASKRTREPLERMLRGMTIARPSARGTTLLHPPVGVLAISIAGALDDMRERNLAYVIDHVESRVVLARQIRLLGNLVLINTAIPHLCVVAPPAQERDARFIFGYAEQVLAEIGGEHFTCQLVIRHADGRFEEVVSLNAVSGAAR